MLNLLRFTGVLLSLIAFSSISQAANISLSLSAPGTDLENIQVGQDVTINVLVSDLNGTELGFLAAEVDFDPVIFGTPTNFMAGSIIPDIFGFGPEVALPGVAQDGYDSLFSLSNEPIATDGVFFSFTVTAQEIGTGTFLFVDLTTMFGYNALDNNFPVQVVDVSFGEALHFTVVPASVVPQPPGWLLLSLGIGLIGSLRIVRHKISCQG